MKIYGVGGFNEVGKNMTAIDLGDDVILFDCGLFLPPIVELEEAEKVYTNPPIVVPFAGTNEVTKGITESIVRVRIFISPVIKPSEP